MGAGGKLGSVPVGHHSEAATNGNGSRQVLVIEGDHEFSWFLKEERLSVH